MGLVTHIDPHAGIGGLAGVQHRHDGVVGGHYMRGPHALSHQLIQRFDQIGHIAAPD